MMRRAQQCCLVRSLGCSGTYHLLRVQVSAALWLYRLAARLALAGFSAPEMLPPNTTTSTYTAAAAAGGGGDLYCLQSLYNKDATPHF
jgi:hypothetical protein